MITLGDLTSIKVDAYKLSENPSDRCYNFSRVFSLTPIRKSVRIILSHIQRLVRTGDLLDLSIYFYLKTRRILLGTILKIFEYLDFYHVLSFSLFSIRIVMVQLLL